VIPGMEPSQRTDTRHVAALPARRVWYFRPTSTFVHAGSCTEPSGSTLRRPSCEANACKLKPGTAARRVAPGPGTTRVGTLVGRWPFNSGAMACSGDVGQTATWRCIQCERSDAALRAQLKAGVAVTAINLARTAARDVATAGIARTRTCDTKHSGRCCPLALADLTPSSHCLLFSGAKGWPALV
jgi:hypothetical protein